ncbi:MAG: N-succinylarginine dihydrolase, partial [Plesiomonas sp.]
MLIQNKIHANFYPLPRHEGKIMHSVEVNFDGLVGPTHNYAGLSV